MMQQAWPKQASPNAHKTLAQQITHQAIAAGALIGMQRLPEACGVACVQVHVMQHL